MECTDGEFLLRVRDKIIQVEEIDPNYEDTQFESVYQDDDLKSNLSEEDEIIEGIEEKFYIEDESTVENDAIIHDSSASETSIIMKSVDEDIEMKIVVDSLDSDSFTCDCGLVFSTEKEMQRHNLLHNNRKSSTNSHQPQISCEYCGISFKDLKYFKIHEKAHESFEAILPQLTMFQCNDCLSVFSNEEDYATHIALHKSKIASVEESLIERMSAFEDHYIHEKDIVDDEISIDEQVFSCGHCGKKKSENHMKLHLLFFHTCLIFCPLDNRCFEGHKQVRLFADHIKNKHPEVFDKKVEYICTCCSAKFSTQFEKLAHMKSCNMKKYVCFGHCNKRFKSEWLLNKHLKLIEVGGEKRFTCSMCPKQCVSKSDLQIHMRSHTNERPYRCKFFETFIF